jgi:hypothetical protein
MNPPMPKYIESLDLFIYGLFNEDGSTSGYMASNDRMISEK